ncbi:MAG TPA: hypothetical protein VEB64_01265, partial [Azospirillaceae bacterium]|nr:hypothetical protein [Azospirillaceae bacterium]
AVYRRHRHNMSNGFLNLLPDLNQRRAVIERFIADQGHRFPDPPGLRRLLERSLAEDALEYARRAFVRNNVPVCEECATFALDLDPQICRTPAWARLARTRLVSPKVWTALRSVRDRVRRVTDTLRAASPRPVQW